MATPYSDIINVFLRKIKGYELNALYIDTKEELVLGYLDSARSKFYKKCKHDLTLVDNQNLEFTEDLNIDEIDILAELMITEWLFPQMYSDELLESRMNTKDFTEYSPAKLIEQIRTVFKESKHNSKQLITDYTYDNNDITAVNKDD
jgi:hypothetical protein